MNVALDHIAALNGAAAALKNGDIPLFNRIGNSYAQATGKSAPTTFAALRDFVADEVGKAIIGSGGGVSDRSKAQDTISAANSPEQLAGTLGGFQRLMAGQLGGLKQQFMSSTGRSEAEFNAKLAPGTLKTLEHFHGGGQQIASGRAPPPVGTVVRGHRYTGGDPASQASWTVVQ